MASGAASRDSARQGLALHLEHLGDALEGQARVGERGRGLAVGHDGDARRDRLDGGLPPSSPIRGERDEHLPELRPDLFGEAARTLRRRGA